MKKILSILLSILTLTVMAQVPQGVGYQGVATDANGIELVNQSISIRASVLSGSVSGTIEWEETHATSTDTFGLFTITIGQGTSTGNGIQADFADISWGINTHFLKIEMDVNGGTNYAFMGTNQMMSVPYALYAESANISYDSIANYLSGDTTFITNVSSGLGGGGCDILFPDGLDGDPIHWSFDYQGSYTVPAGKTLYMLKEVNWDGTIIVNGITSNISVYWNSPLIIGENSIVDDNPGDGSFYGFLVDKKVTPVTWSFTQGNYTVPPGKILYILKESSWNGIITVNGFTYQTGLEIGKPLIIGENGIIDAGSGFGSFNGYLIDENYFADCGGGNSSSSSVIDSSYIDSLVQFYTSGNGGGCDYAFPDGLYGEPVQIDLLNSNYTVPSGKNLYLLRVRKHGGSNTFLTVNNLRHSEINESNFQATAQLPLIVKSGDELSYNWGANPTEVTIYGILIDPVIEPVQIDLLNSNYTVPSGKNLYLTRVRKHGGSNTFLTVNNLRHSEINESNFQATAQLPLIVKSGDELSYNWGGTNPTEVTIYGYLADENYFAGCGGGNSSSSSIIDSSYIDSLVQFYSNGNGSGCDFNWPTGINGQPIIHNLQAGDYIVPSGKNLYITHSVYSQHNATITINGYEIIKPLESPSFPKNKPLLLKEGDIVSHISPSGTPAFINFSGLLSDINPQVTPIVQDITSNTYVVPTGKHLIITHSLYESSSAFLTVNSTEILLPSESPTFPTLEPLVTKAGDIISYSSPGSPNFVHFGGYLADENYFANCGGGGSSTTSNLDSTAIANMIAAAGGGCNFNYPDGLNGTPVIHDFIANGPYTVPAGKNFYTNMIFNNNSDDVLINSIKFHDSGTMNSSLNIVLSEGDVISMTYNGGNTPPHKNMFGLLVDKKVQSLSYDFLANGAYTVPAGKELYIYRIYHSALRVEVNSLELANYNQLTNGSNDVTFSNHLILKAGDVIDIIDQGSGGLENMFGYLADENYFAGCGGGGGSSSSSSLDSTAIANMIAAAGGSGCDPQFPDGFEMLTAVASTYSATSPYTVPQNKRLYIAYSNTNVLINGIDIGIPGGKHIICNPGDILSSNGSTYQFSGFLVNCNPSITAIASTYSATSPYTVPQNKRLYIAYSNTNVLINGIDIGIPGGKHIICNPGDILSSNGSTYQFSGYLADENYFSGCGGGGSSSTSNTNNQINNYNNILNLSATSGDFNYLYASYPTNSSFNYTVPAGKIMKITDVKHYNVSNSNPTYINGQLWHTSSDLPTLLSEGTQVEIQFDYAGDGVSIQYELIDNTQGITLNYLYASYPNSSSFNYSVPAGKIMKITDVKHYNVSNSNPTYINGQLWHTSSDLPTLLSEGTQVEIQFDYAGDGISIQYILFNN